MKFLKTSRVVVLRPEEFSNIYKILDTNRKAQFGGLLCIGTRYIEAKWIQKHPECYDGDRFIHLPKEGSSKKKSLYEERTIRISDWGRKILPKFFDATPLPTTQAWGEDLKRWALKAGYVELGGLCAKTTRKTWEGWLFSSFKGSDINILSSQGHTQTTSLKHYINIGFYPKDTTAMKKYVVGWI
jgi:hypothetical protein